jgi:hypothetical protein
VVHALLSGKPLCGFSNEPPTNWPAGHLWTHVEDIYNITCRGCRNEAEGLLNPKKAKLF